MASMRRGVSAEESTGKTAGNQFTQRLLVDVTLKNWQAVKVRAYAANQHMIAVKHQVLWCNRGGNKVIAIAHVFRRVFGGDMFKHDLQARQPLAQWLHDGIDKARFAVENVDIGVGHFPVNQQRHPPVPPYAQAPA
ncbi:Uncharacterised protein [Kluyvera intermedia]|nr:Uncharacterised protein [Kluyvera intermedia]